MCGIALLKQVFGDSFHLAPNMSLVELAEIKRSCLLGRDVRPWSELQILELALLGQLDVCPPGSDQDPPLIVVLPHVGHFSLGPTSTLMTISTALQTLHFPDELHLSDQTTPFLTKEPVLYGVLGLACVLPDSLEDAPGWKWAPITSENES